MILDCIKINRKRFAQWAMQYLNMPPNFFENGTLKYEDTVISYMFENGLFTLQEMKANLKQNKIYISERRLKRCAEMRKHKNV